MATSIQRSPIVLPANAEAASASKLLMFAGSSESANAIMGKDGPKCTKESAVTTPTLA